MPELTNLDRRIEAIEDVLSSAAAGDLDVSLELADEKDADALTSVEFGINMMLQDLRAARDKDRERARELERMLEVAHEQSRRLEETLEVVRNQQASIAELSTPVLQLWDDVLAMPIIGVVDTRRSMDIMEKLLHEVSARSSRYVILDITGVEVVDTKTADHFIKVAQAAQLLGATCFVSGIRPAVAQTLVEIGVDLSAVTTVSTLQDGLRECLRRMGRLQTVVRKS